MTSSGQDIERGQMMSPIDVLRERGVSLALGGGAARGIAHIGVLRVLGEEGIPIRAVAGTSAGSIVGAALAAGRDWRWMVDRVREISWPDLVSLSIPRMGLLRTDRLERFLDRALGSKRIEELEIPFAAVAVDLVAGELVVLREGPVAAAVRASCSVPGIFKPVRIGAKVLVDGGLLDGVPADVARTLAGPPVLAVNLNGDSWHEEPPRSVFDVLYYSLDIMARSSQHRGLQSADVVVSPDLRGLSYQDLRRWGELVARGERAARDALAAARHAATAGRLAFGAAS
jgi:NTE family protein